MTYADNEYQAFRVGGGAVNPSPVYFNIPSTLGDPRGTIKFNPEGTMLGNTSVGDGAVIADFDNATGRVSNQRELQITSPYTSAYGVEFSPNSRILYLDVNSSSGGNGCGANESRGILQYGNLNSAAGLNSPIVLWSWNGENTWSITIRN